MKITSTNKYFKDLVLLFFLTLLVYWPLSTNYLSLKNDALVQYLAYRYHLSESIRHGFLPFWSPYLYTGFPIHADIQGEVWNPLVLFLSLISRYDMTILQWEVLIYLFLSAIGMYRLVNYLGLSRVTSICCAVAFMSCGYMTDSVSVIPWIPSAALIPFVLLYFLRSLKSLHLSDYIKFSICLSLMFLCGYPSFFIYLNYIIAFSFLFWVTFQIRSNNKKGAVRALLFFGVAYFLFLLICSPAIISYYEFLPYYSRGVGVTLKKAGENPLVPFSSISYLLPNAPSKAAFLSTDLSMRNTYVGLFIFLFFLTSFKKPGKFKTVILVFTIFSFLFSLGPLIPLQKISYLLFPLINTFRHPGTIRVFTSVGIILLAAYSLDAFFKNGKERIMQSLCYLTLIFLGASGIYFLVTEPAQTKHVAFGFKPPVLKQFLYNLSFEKFALLLCLLQIIFVLAFLILQKKISFTRKATIVLFIFNSVVFAWIGLPFTVVSQYKTSEVNNYIHSFPEDYPTPDINGSVESEVYSDFVQISPHGYYNFYNKKITVQDQIVTPTLNTDYYRFLENDTLRWQLKDHPFVFVSQDSLSILPAQIKLLKFSPNYFSFRINSPVAGILQFFQQYNPNWIATVNDQAATISKSNIAFMNVNIPAGASVVEWKYRPKNVYIGMVLSAVSLLAVVFYFVFKRKWNRDE